MTAGGFPTPGGSGNGAPPRLNDVDAPDPEWQLCRAEIEAEYPWLVEDGVFDGTLSLMRFLDVEEGARHLGGNTWLLTTPDDHYPVLAIVFEYVEGQITVRRADVDDA